MQRRFKICDDQLVIEEHENVVFTYTCPCGWKNLVTLRWPIGVTIYGGVKLSSKCDLCNEPIELPEGSYFAEKNRLEYVPY